MLTYRKGRKGDAVYILHFMFGDVDMGFLLPVSYIMNGGAPIFHYVVSAIPCHTTISQLHPCLL